MMRNTSVRVCTTLASCPPRSRAVPQLSDHQAAHQREGLRLAAPELHEQHRGDVVQTLIVMHLTPQQEVGRAAVHDIVAPPLRFLAFCSGVIPLPLQMMMQPSCTATHIPVDVPLFPEGAYCPTAAFKSLWSFSLSSFLSPSPMPGVNDQRDLCNTRLGKPQCSLGTYPNLDSLTIVRAETDTLYIAND